MKKLTLFIAIFATFSLSGCFSAKTTEVGRSYDTAQIEYKWTGAIEGTETFYASGFKTRSEIKTTTKVEGVETNQDLLVINNGEYIYKIDTTSKLALKETSPYKDEVKNKSPEELKELRIRMALYLKEGEEMPKSTGTEVVAGKKCEVYELGNGTKKYLWNEQVLKTEVVVDGAKATQEATSVEIDKNIEDGLFNLPGDAVVQDLSN